MILECDVGNTRCKWRLLDGLKVVRSDSFVHQQGFGDLADLAGINRARVSCVASLQVKEQLKAQLLGLGIEVEFAESGPAAAGVLNGYKEPSRLGVDRWLAIVAAYQRQRGAVLVLDAGSALTADMVAADGRHLGGYIVPGAGLMRDSLLSSTGGVRFNNDERDVSLIWGCTTLDAVNAGILAAQLGAVKLAIEQGRRQFSTDFAILLTGGDAEVIAKHLSLGSVRAVEVVPELVLDGLGLLMP